MISKEKSSWPRESEAGQNTQGKQSKTFPVSDRWPVDPMRASNTDEAPEPSPRRHLKLRGLVRHSASNGSRPGKRGKKVQVGFLSRRPPTLL